MDFELINNFEVCKTSVKNILPYTMRGLITQDGEKETIFTIHTESHSLSVESKLKQIIDICNNSQNENCNINYESEYILLCSAWLHDLGCIIDRNNHGKASAKIILENLDCIKGIDNYDKIISQICGTHTFNRAEEDPIQRLNKRIISPRGEIIHPQYLASIFRLADACDLDKYRAPYLVYKLLKDNMKDESVEYFKAHDNVFSCGFEKDRIIITYFEKTDLDKKLFNDLKKQLGEVSLFLNEYDFPIKNVEIEYVDSDENWKKYLDED